MAEKARWDGRQKSERHGSMSGKGRTEHQASLLVQLLSGWRPSTKKHLHCCLCPYTQVAGIEYLPSVSQSVFYVRERQKQRQPAFLPLEPKATTWRHKRTLQRSSQVQMDGAVNQVYKVPRQYGFGFNFTECFTTVSVPPLNNPV